MRWLLKETGWLVCLVGGLGALLALAAAVASFPGPPPVATPAGSGTHSARLDAEPQAQPETAGLERSTVAVRFLRAVRRQLPLAVSLALPIVLLGYSAVRERRKMAAWLASTPSAVLLGLAGGLALIAAGAAYEAGARALGADLPDVAQALKESLPAPLLVLISCVLAPAGEEMYFRGRLFDAVEERCGPLAAAMITALLFGLFHGVPVLLPGLVGLGLILAVLRWYSGGLVAPILAHLVNNALGLATLQ